MIFEIKRCIFMIAMPWLLALLGAINGLSETVYIYALPLISAAMGISEGWTEITMTAEFFGFAMGLLFWGNLSDRLGRRKCVLSGLAIYTTGYVGCAMASSLFGLLGFRLIQAFGAAVTSVLVQAIRRDIYSEADISRTSSFSEIVYVVLCMLSPLVGMAATHFFGWRGVCLFGALVGFGAWFLAINHLPETFKKSERVPDFKKTAKRFFRDPLALQYAAITAVCLGVRQMCFMEFTFFCKNTLLRMVSLVVILLFCIGGSLLSVYMRRFHDAHTTMEKGLKIAFVGALFFLTVLLALGPNTPLPMLLAAFLIPAGAMMGGVTMAVQNSCSVALVGYERSIGSATSWFSASYYAVISAMTFGMGMFHGDTLVPMAQYSTVLLLIAGTLSACMFHRSQISLSDAARR